ncbi:MAG: hypothetical protein ACI93L_002462 [Cyclobacteriaceae bacterium]|jgi:hypothetical protein
MQSTTHFFSSLFVNLLFLIVFTSCIDEDTGVTLVGSDNIISEARQAAGFKEINISGVLAVDIRYGEEYSVTVRANDNIISRITTETSLERISIRLATDNNSLENIIAEVVIITPELVKITNEGISTIDLSGFEQLSTLTIQSQGIGNITATGSVVDLSLTLTGIGSYSGFDFIADQCEIDLEGIGSAEVTAKESLTGSLKGIGNLSYKGDADVQINDSGIGTVVNAN